MGILSAQNPVLLIYDLGMAKMYTDSEGKVCFVGDLPRNAVLPGPPDSYGVLHARHS